MKFPRAEISFVITNIIGQNRVCVKGKLIFSWKKMNFFKKHFRFSIFRLILLIRWGFSSQIRFFIDKNHHKSITNSSLSSPPAWWISPRSSLLFVNYSYFLIIYAFFERFPFLTMPWKKLARASRHLQNFRLSPFLPTAKEPMRPMPHRLFVYMVFLYLTRDRSVL